MKKLSLLLFLLLLFGCKSDKQNTHAIETLLQADRDFSDLSVEKGMNHAFKYFCARDAVLLRENSRPLEGAETIEKTLLQADDTAIELSWAPLHATVARSGDLGYTYGTFTMKNKETGEMSHGTYVSIWVKEDGSWKWILDSGNQGLGG